MTKKEAVEKFNQEVKKEATIKVKTLFAWIGIITFGIAMFIAGWFIRSDFANEVRAEVSEQMVVVELKAKQ